MAGGSQTDITQLKQEIDTAVPTKLDTLVKGGGDPAAAAAALNSLTLGDVGKLMARQVGKRLAENAVCGESALAANPQNTGPCLHHELKNAPLSVSFPVGGGDLVFGAGYNDSRFELIPDATPIGNGAYVGASFSVKF